jgi:uncharacterized protein YqeY
MSILERVQADTKAAMKARERERVGALRMISNSLQNEAKEGGDDEIAVLRRERKRRLEAAEAYREGGSEDRAASEEAEAEVISSYLPAELSDEEIAAIVDDAIAEAGAESPSDMGKVMGPAMGKIAGRADGKRVNAIVREKLASI